MKRRIEISLALAMMIATATPGVAADKKPVERKRDPNAIRCVKLPVTGSLAQTRRICMTNRDWDQQQADALSMRSLVCSNQAQCAGR